MQSSRTTKITRRVAALLWGSSLLPAQGACQLFLDDRAPVDQLVDGSLPVGDGGSEAGDVQKSGDLGTDGTILRDALDDEPSQGSFDADGTQGLGVLHQPCGPIGAFACTGRANKGLLVCSGVWVPNGTCGDDQNCDSTPGPTLGSCVPLVAECRGQRPQDRVCVGGNVVACGPDLVTTVPVQTCTGTTSACVEGACVPCAPNPTPTGCSGNTPQFCNESRAWQDREAGACSGATPECLAGACVACVPNSRPTACAEHTPRFCNASGAWQDREAGACFGATPVCLVGACVACAPSAMPTRCADSTPQFCAVSGAWQDRAEGACAPESACQSGRCVPRATNVALGSDHSCVRFNNGAIKCWGTSSRAQLGIGDGNTHGDEAGEMGLDLPPVDLGAHRTAVSLATGWAHTCALLDDKRLKCWGDNNFWRLGIGRGIAVGDDPNEMGDQLPAVNLGTGLHATMVALGLGHSCALLESGQIKCWGDNEHGQLGYSDAQDSGSTADPMGDSLPVVNLGAGRRAVAIAAGSDHTCALLDNGQIKCWGDNSEGQLGLGDTNDRGDEAGEMGDDLPTVALGTGRRASMLATWSAHTCVLLDNGQMKCWGANDAGQLGLGDVNHRGDQVDEMGDRLPAIDLGVGRSAKAIAVGDEHTCALLDNAQVKCWGGNGGGQLGLGDTKRRGDDPGEMGNHLPAVDLGTGRVPVAIAAAVEHTCALLSTGHVMCWGGNGDGELGLGDNVNRGDGPDEMGNHLPTVVLW